MKIDFEIKGVKFRTEGELPEPITRAASALAEFVCEGIDAATNAGGVKTLIETIKAQLFE